MVAMVDLAAEERRERSLHVVDIENLLGNPRARGPEVTESLDHYARISGWKPGDLVFVAANPALALLIGIEWQISCSLHAARGTDGADLALLESCLPEFVVSRVGRLVIGSGDGIFAGRAHQVSELGIPVVVVARLESLSNDLQGQGFGIRPFEAPTRPVPTRDAGFAVAA